MNRTSLISLTAVVLAAVMAGSVNAQENPSAPAKPYSIGPVLEFGGGGSSFGIQGKIGVSPQFSVRPMILFGYKPSVSRSDLNQLSINALQQPPNAVSADTAQAITNSPSGQSAVDFVSGTLGSGTAYGVAATYDFKSPESKISGYVGPRIMFASASGSGLLTTTSTSETSIGLTAGADYAISPDFTAGLSATYNFSRSGTLSLTNPAGTASTSISGGNFNIGVNFGYNF